MRRHRLLPLGLGVMLSLGLLLGSDGSWLIAPSLAHPGQRADDDSAEQQPSQAQIDQRLARIRARYAERKARREQRRREQRARLEARLTKLLAGRPVSAQITQGLRQQARRSADLRRIRAVAAESDDYATVVRADHVLARESSRFEAWLLALGQAGEP
jgi:hypothetical protein